VVNQTSIAKDIDPAHGPDDKADPEREHNEKQEDCLVSGSASIEEICRDIAHYQAQSDSLKRNADGSEKDGRIEKVGEELGVITELKRRYVSATGGAQPETVHHDKAHRNDQQKEDSTHCWCEQSGRFPGFILHQIK
jgi:hypothetical protein